MRICLFACLIVAASAVPAARAGVLAPDSMLTPLDVAAGTGTLSGLFQDPRPAGATFTYDGPNRIQYGVPVEGSVPSALQFDGRPFENVAVGEVFVAGLLSYRNGTTVIGTTVNSIDLLLETSAPDPLFTQSLSVELSLFTTPNLGVDPFADADFVIFPDYPNYGSFGVFEGLDTSVEILAAFGSLEFRGFGNVTNPAAGFVTSTFVPEPASVALWGTALVLASVWSARRLRRI